MSDRVSQINELLRSELAKAISENRIMNDGLITVARAKCSPDLKNATIVVSVLPENKSGTALRVLKRNTALLSRPLHRFKMKFVPRLHWAIDSQARFGAEMDKVFNEIENGKEKDD